MRVLGLVLFSLGTAVSVVTALALYGLPVRIELFAFDLDTRGERIALALGAVMRGDRSGGPEDVKALAALKDSE